LVSYEIIGRNGELGLRALFSLHDATHAVEFASDLHRMGWEIVCTNETHSLLKESRIPSTTIGLFTGTSKGYEVPPTLHPKVEWALTGGSQDSRIDLVFDIPYPISKGYDVGGTTLLALAIKGGKIPVFTNDDMKRVISEFKTNGEIDDELRSSLLAKANLFIAQHYIQMLQQAKKGGDGWVGAPIMKLLTGENPYQVPCHLLGFPENEDPLSLRRFDQLSGTVPCFTSLADLDNIIHTLCLAYEAFNKRFGKTPYLALAAKHGNACGFGADWENPEIAIEKALFGNPTAIWGGEFVCNFSITGSFAKLLYESDARKKNLGSGWWMLDLVAAPSFSSEARAVLGRRKDRKLMINKSLTEPKLSNSTFIFRPVRGGFLRQPPPNYILDFDEIELDGANFTEQTLGSLILAWAVSWSSNLGGNEISLVKDLQMIGSGGGPATTIAACNALARAREQEHVTHSSVFAADAFFPFTDAPKILIQAGCSEGLVPKGGKLEKQIRELFQNHQVDMGFLPQNYRGFCRH
jgi:phosphoribosylaminoimidazolecarboxamide formyltransferase/IMP cyclohydrolase